MAKEIDCPQCDGRGYNEEFEGGRLVQDACYHCGNTGKISPEQYRSDQITAACESLAILYVGWLDEKDRNHPDGDNFGLIAAESGLQVHEYLKVMTWDYTSKIGKLFDQQPQSFIDAVTDGQWTPEVLAFKDAKVTGWDEFKPLRIALIEKFGAEKHREEVAQNPPVAVAVTPYSYDNDIPF